MMDGKGLAAITKSLRKRSTPWEQKMWYYLRGKRLYGLKFKRQVPMGGFVVDFCCQENKLIIELDGSQHNQIKNKILDIDRQKFLESNGYKVLRFWNNDLDKNIEGVLEEIKRNIEV